MKWIEGKSGKSLVLERLLGMEQGLKTLLIDNVGVGALHSLVTDVMCFNSNDEMWEAFSNDDYEDFAQEIKNNRYEMIIFETNDHYSTLDNYSAIEDKTGVPVLVTIQNDAMNDVKIYEV
jgi:hypothetical protein